MDTRSAAQRSLAGGSAVLALLTTTVYLVVIQQEGDNAFWDVFPWVAIMLIGAFLGLGSALTPNAAVGRFAATAASVVLGLLGMVAILSVGLGFIVAALLALLAAAMPSATAV